MRRKVAVRMSPGKTERLITTYPKLFSRLNEIECEDGWYILLDNLCSILELEINGLARFEQPYFYAIRIYNDSGSLRVYMKQQTLKMDGALITALKFSAYTCELCGNQGSKRIVEGKDITLCNIDYENLKK